MGGTFNPMSFLSPKDLEIMMAGANRTGNSVSNYAQNYERRKSIRGSLYPPAMGRMPHRGVGSVNGPNVVGNFGIDQSQVDAADTALSPFGLHTPSHINPFLFFNDQHQDGSQTWAGNHPHVARALEGAMLGTQVPGGDTIGENVSNVMRTIMGIPGLYRQNATAQVMAPFQEAHEIAGLQKTQAQIEAENAQTDLSNAHAEYFRNADQREKHPNPSIHFNNDGEAVVYDPAQHDFLKRPDLNGSPKTERSSPMTDRDIISMKNAERAAKGKPPLNSDEQLAVMQDVYKRQSIGKGAGRRPYVDPNFKFRVEQAHKNIEIAKGKYDSLKPRDYTESLLWSSDPSEAGKKRFSDYQSALKQLQDAQDTKDQLMEQHYSYSVNAQDTQGNEDTQGNDEDIPTPIAPVRVPGVDVKTNDGQSGALVPGPAINGRPSLQIAPQPGTTRPAKSKTLDESAARKYLQAAGGDKDKARKAAAKDGYKF
jgi:hypothetical protein